MKDNIFTGVMTILIILAAMYGPTISYKLVWEDKVIETICKSVKQESLNVKCKPI